MAREAGLLYVVDRMPGIIRERCGSGFRYLTPSRRRLRDAGQLRRIAALAIPPAYRSVWICPSARGHLQATGRDARGRKQYRYHAQWREIRDCAKFERVASFAAALPKLRRRLRADLSLPGLPLQKVLAVVVSLLNSTTARVGNVEYARDNQSFGITTLRSRHVSFTRGGRAQLSFVGKGGVHHEIIVDDRRVVSVVRRCQALPGQHLFQYLDAQGERRPVDSGLVNDYLRDVMGAEFTAKDFRTWNATVHALALLSQVAPRPDHPAQEKKIIVSVIKEVAQALRNTPAVCRKSYINPELFAAWRQGLIQRRFGGRVATHGRRSEARVVRFLRSKALRTLTHNPGLPRH
jgi:DNA topoisomerase I